jgi:hypothetical protein
MIVFIGALLMLVAYDVGSLLVVCPDKTRTLTDCALAAIFGYAISEQILGIMRDSR